MIFSEDRLPEFRKRLFAWFKATKRDLPWRMIPADPNRPIFRDPYPVWISEIMLQQTTTAAVEGYFRRFLARFPDLPSLANADQKEVFQLWEGLGYYRRAALLHRAAQTIMEKYNGQFPENYHDVLNLPGIGRYTAGAILSIAFDQRLPILEANTIRLHSRLIGLEEDPSTRKGSERLWEFAEKILPQKKVGIFNQILMDLGSLICTPKAPRCEQCPAVAFCSAAKTGSQDLIPAAKKKAEKEYRNEAAFLVRKSRKDRRFLLIRYPQGCRWAGLWDFPRFLQISDQDPGTDPLFPDRITALIGSLTGRSKEKEIRTGSLLHKMKHTVTRYGITLYFFDTERTDKIISLPRSKEIELAAGTVVPADLEFLWTDPQTAKDLPMSSSGR
ncbi:MAG: A/G-specific adenine glycosylase, partial [Planctomycetia bacterium]|nr:A/G-specific adenine glycosylase [Planctomycetia bacterium]